MESNLSQQDLLAHVNQLWTMLDDLAESNHEGYQRFIERHLKEGMEHMAPPEAHSCVQTRILKPKEDVLFINLCSWKRVPAPQSNSEPVPLGGGKMEKMLNGPDPVTVIDIAYNPAVLKLGEDDQVEMDQLIRLAMKYIQEEHKLTLSHSYIIPKCKLKGNAERMRLSLMNMCQKHPVCKKDSGERMGKQIVCGQKKNITNKSENDINACVRKVSEGLLIQQMKNMLTSNHGNKEFIASTDLISDSSSSTKQKNKCLIEEISSTELHGEHIIETPDHKLQVVKDENGNARKIVLSVDLPDVCSVTECSLSVSQDDALVEVPGKYQLLVDLPMIVNEDTITAKFSKTTHTLSVTSACFVVSCQEVLVLV
ncbi:PIH1 domain-containing protein 2 [Protopterus annectens]|uniref:PIH1 domain-containing protein 2 n=1 Tax=Protopterus annectens TaxID=7888 RepID=UPI001CFA8E50|nr:PIH1 domain-containing protein 2 [Protopterus annectens]